MKIWGMVLMVGLTGCVSSLNWPPNNIYPDKLERATEELLRERFSDAAIAPMADEAEVAALLTKIDADLRRLFSARYAYRDRSVRWLSPREVIVAVTVGDKKKDEVGSHESYMFTYQKKLSTWGSIANYFTGYVVIVN